jgi:hypothetical protein
MILTTSECKTLIREGSTDYDAIIGELIPIVQEDIIEHTNNTFFSRQSIVYGNGISFSTSTGGGDKISDTEEDFQEDETQFVIGDVYVHGSKHNDGVHEVASVADGTLTLSSSGGVVAEDADAYVTVAQIEWPKALKLTAAKMVWYQVKNHKMNDEQSETREGKGVTYAGANMYPERLMNSLRNYMIVRSA